MYIIYIVRYTKLQVFVHDHNVYTMHHMRVLCTSLVHVYRSPYHLCSYQSGPCREEWHQTGQGKKNLGLNCLCSSW